ncbi:hypothetical protein ARMSODRAFT_134936 [Armillaria solidipes]|uniref:NAD(P)-binding protein n=1 Tax=Armillaria solidipes TaxID=1076256 RepID=A0A2H3ATY3_9AGAR|nr:hypothetical protein ARMSODRAFT_134936 [Armillaria solidipes]
MRTERKKLSDRLNEEGRGPGLGEVIWHELDLKDPRSARNRQNVSLLEKYILISVNNAALSVIIIFVHPGSKFMVLSMILALGDIQALNPDGIWEGMAVNSLGPYIFTKTLLPLFESTASLNGANVRIINVGSGGYRYAKYLEYDSKETWNHP